MNDRGARLHHPWPEVGSDSRDTGNIAGSRPDGTHDEGACQVLRPRAQHHDWRAINRGKLIPRSNRSDPCSEDRLIAVSDARIKRLEIVV
jgi:hypothetical protein